MKALKNWLIFVLIVFIYGCIDKNESGNEESVKELVYKHAKAWESGDADLLNSILHDDVVFAYPGRRLNKSETLQDLLDYNKSFEKTKIYVNKIVVDGEDLAVEWQFASTSIKTGNRTAVSDAILGKVKDGKIIIWKEYLDGRVSRMQANGSLALEEGDEPFPWPRKR